MDIESIKNIFTIDVIIQGALGSFLFWLAFEVIKRSSLYGSKLLSKFSKQLKKEMLLYEQAHSALEIKSFSKSEPTGLTLKLTMIKMSLHKGFHGLIYIILGVIAQPYFGNFSAIAYTIAIFYIYRASKVVKVELESTKDESWHIERVKEISIELEELDG